MNNKLGQNRYNKCKMDCFSFTTSCRICLQIKPTNKSLFQYRNDSREPTNVKLSLITGIHVPEEEEHDIPEYPKFLCKECERLLDMAFDLRIKAQKSDEILNNFYNQIESNLQPVLKKDKRKRVLNCKIQTSSKSTPSTPILNSSFTIETSKRSVLNTDPNHTLKTNSETPAINETEYTLRTYRSPSKEKDTEDPLTKQRIDFEDSNDSIYEVLSVEGLEENCDIKDEIVEEDFVENKIPIEKGESSQMEESNRVMEEFTIEKVAPENKIDLLKIKTEWEEEIDDNEKINSKFEEISACNEGKNDNSQVHLKRKYNQEISSCKTEFNLNGIKKENGHYMDNAPSSEVNKTIDFKDNFVIKMEPDFEVEQNGEFKLTQGSDVDAKRVKLENMIDMNDIKIDFESGLLFVKAKSNAPSDFNLST